MKKLVLLIIGLLMGLTPVAGAETLTANQELDFTNSRYRFAEPIVFIERGVEFLIFPDGSFDFNTDLFTTVGTAYYRNNRSRRGGISRTFGAPGTLGNSYYHPVHNGGVIILHDHFGRVRRIGNVFINYDRLGRIKRAGSVYMNYQKRTGLLRQVGGLRVQYNRWGEIIHFSGFVNRSNANLNQGLGLGTGFGGAVYDNPNFNDDFDNDFFYYRKNGEVKKHRRLKSSRD